MAPVRVERRETRAAESEAAAELRAEIQITTRECLIIKNADLSPSSGLRGPLALLAL